MPNIPFMHREKTLEELQSEDEKASLEYSIEQKKAAIREARRRGIDPQKSFGGNISSLIKWFKNH